MVLSTGVPSLADKRYFLSQMSSDASWKGMASTSLVSSLTTLFMDGYRSPMFRPVLNSPEPEKKNDPQPVVPTDPRGLLRTAVRQLAILNSPALPIIKTS